MGSNRTLSALPARFSSGEALQQLSYQSEEDLGAALQQAAFHSYKHYVLVIDLWFIRVGDDSDLKEFFSQVPLSQGRYLYPSLPSGPTDPSPPIIITVSILVVGKPDRQRLAIICGQDWRYNALQQKRIFFWEELRGADAGRGSGEGEVEAALDALLVGIDALPPISWASTAIANLKGVLGFGQTVGCYGSSSVRSTAALIFTALLLLVCCYVAWWLLCGLPGKTVELQKERQTLHQQREADQKAREEEKRKLAADTQALQRVTLEMEASARALRARQQRAVDALAAKHGKLQDLVDKRMTVEATCARHTETLNTFPSCQVTRTALKTLEEQSRDLLSDEQEWRSILSDPLYNSHHD